MKTVWVNRLGIAIAIIGVGLVYAVVSQWLNLNSWWGQVGWIIFLQLMFDRLIHRKKQALTKLWALADQLGYDASKLSQFTPQYGRLDRELVHPDNLQFQPSDAAIAKVTAQLEHDLEAQA